MGHPSRRAFTVIELLVVIGIIAILISLGFLVASRVSGSGKQRVTEQSLRILDSALASYISSNGGKNPPPTIKDPTSTATNPRWIPVIDGRDGDTQQFVNSVGLFMEQMKSDPGAYAQFKDLDPKLVKEIDVDDVGAQTGPQPRLLTAIDGWGNPIRYVHPRFKGYISEASTTPIFRQTASVLGNPQTGTYAITRIRRVGDRDRFSSGGEAPTWYQPTTPPIPQCLDADEGIPLSDRPYFYSCGADGFPDWKRKDPDKLPNDNVYLTTPKFLAQP